MATLEALDELYAMGFLMEEEYRSRRAALGGAELPSSKPEVSPILETPIQPEYVTAPIYEHPVIMPVDEIPAQIERATEEPKLAMGEAVDLKDLAHIRISPIVEEDSVSTSKFTPPPGKALVVWRTSARYQVFEVGVGSTVGDVTKMIKTEGKLYPIGKDVATDFTEYYYPTVTWQLAPPLSGPLENAVYVFREKRFIPSDKEFAATVIDERLLMRHLRKNLESTTPGGIIEEFDDFNGFVRPYIRTMSDPWVGYSSYDPKYVLQLLNVCLIEKREWKASGPTKTNFKLKTRDISKSTFMLLPMFVGMLKALERKAPEEIVRRLPTTMFKIWQRVTECLQNGTCYFWGSPAVSGSFLGANIHNEHIVDTYYKIKELGLAPTEATHDPAASQVDNPKMSYDANFPKATYGWPQREDLDHKFSTVRQLHKTITHRRESLIEGLTIQLAKSNGPTSSVPQIQKQI